MFIEDMDQNLVAQVMAASNMVSLLNTMNIRATTSPENAQFLWYAAQWEYHRSSGTLSVDLANSFIRSAKELYEVSYSGIYG